MAVRCTIPSAIVGASYCQMSTDKYLAQGLVFQKLTVAVVVPRVVQVVVPITRTSKFYK